MYIQVWCTSIMQRHYCGSESIRLLWYRFFFSYHDKDWFFSTKCAAINFCVYERKREQSSKKIILSLCCKHFFKNLSRHVQMSCHSCSILYRFADAATKFFAHRCKVASRRLNKSRNLMEIIVKWSWNFNTQIVKHSRNQI